MVIKLTEFAKRMGVHRRTAWLWFKNGRIPNARQTQTGLILVDVPESCESEVREKTVAYCRVSSSMNKGNLEIQAKRVCDYCAAKGWIVSTVIKEVGSGLNDSRKLLTKVLSDKSVKRIVVEHKDRLTRFGFNYIKTLFPGEVVVINESEGDKEDLMSDSVSVITSFCARIYGLRRNRRRTEKLLEELKKDKD